MSDSTTKPPSAIAGFSLPPRPSSPLRKVSSSKPAPKPISAPATSTLPLLNFALPAKPTFKGASGDPLPSSAPRYRRDSLSPPPIRSRDVYIPGRSPSPPPRRDTYIPDWSGHHKRDKHRAYSPRRDRDTDRRSTREYSTRSPSQSRSPVKRHRERSPSRARDLSPRGRTRTRSLSPARTPSESGYDRRTRSPAISLSQSRSASPRKRSPSTASRDAPPAGTFFTRSHKQEQTRLERAEAARLKKEAYLEKQKQKQEAYEEAKRIKQEQYLEKQKQKQAEFEEFQRIKQEQYLEKKKAKQELYDLRLKEKKAEWEEIQRKQREERGYSGGSAGGVKRQASTDDFAQTQPPNKVAKIPTGPRGIPTGPKGGPSIQIRHITTSSVPTGPRADKPIPTGPKGESSSSREQVVSSSSERETRYSARDIRQRSRSRSFSKSREAADDTSGDEMHRLNRRGPSVPKSNGYGLRAKSQSYEPDLQPSKPATAPGKNLRAPMMTREQIIADHGHGITLKMQWADNPKAPVANYIMAQVRQGDTARPVYPSDSYDFEEGMMGSKRVFRATVHCDPAGKVIGVGDHASKKEAEKLAALSAVYQLSRAGLLDNGKGSAVPDSSDPATTSLSTPAYLETAKLSDGSEISYDQARQFMEYYCARYKFGKPDIEFTQTTAKPSKSAKKAAKLSGHTLWDAVITVGGRKIGMGSAPTKKAAQIKCYLDVTQYLESCDVDLWSAFLSHSKKDKSADLGMAPRLEFQMSDGLNDDIQGLCADIRHSQLYQNAPQSGATKESQPLPIWHSGSSSDASPEELQRKSDTLRQQLDEYRKSSRMQRMRTQRESLPVTSRATEILAKIAVNDVTIVMAATGSGKTTQIPQLLFDEYIDKGEGANCNIICTQPRRLAAMSVAERISDERGGRLGEEIGYQVRFDAKLPKPNGSITFCTTGIFLKRMQSALGTTASSSAVKRMDQITHIVVDEVHERDIDTDLSLVVLKRLLADRKARGIPLKVILMSATIDPSLFQSYFRDNKGRPAPVAEVPGRTFPVQRYYLEDTLDQLRTGLNRREGGWVFEDKKVDNYLNKELSNDKALFGPGTGVELEIPYPLVALTIAHVLRVSDDGHVLVFLPGWEEIKTVSTILLESNLLRLNLGDPSRYSIHYLHSSIPAAEQRAVFSPPPTGVRRIILATNIAETSVTIPDVVYVVDTARVKEKRYDPERHMSSLVSAWVGRSNLDQRAGRAGRHRPGEYYGLLSQNRLNSLESHQLVEMKRSDLSNVVMHVKALNLGKVEDVLAATIEPPESSRIVAAMSLLRMLGALDHDSNLTSLGRVLLQLPVEAAIGKLCLYGSFFRCLDSALTLSAVLTNRDPFIAPIILKTEADAIKDQWSPMAFRSDPLAIVGAYNVWTDIEDQGDHQGATRFCEDNFLSRPVLLQIKQVKDSILQALDQAGVIAVSSGNRSRRIRHVHQIPTALNEHGDSLPLLAALIAVSSAPNFALRTSERTCRTSQDKVVFIHNSSVNSRKRETRGSEEPAPAFNPAEKRLYAFSEKARNIPLGGNPNSAQTFIRNVTRLDPMTYMLFGAYDLIVTRRGVECDSWLPIVGNLHALDDVQRLKTLLDACMLRVFEGVGKSLVRDRDDRHTASRKEIDVRENGSSRILESRDGEEDEAENETAEEDIPSSSKSNGRLAQALSEDEIRELEMLTTDVVRILDAYAAEGQGPA